MAARGRQPPCNSALVVTISSFLAATASLIAVLALALVLLSACSAAGLELRRPASVNTDVLAGGFRLTPSWTWQMGLRCWSPCAYWLRFGPVAPRPPSSSRLAPGGAEWDRASAPLSPAKPNRFGALMACLSIAILKGCTASIDTIVTSPVSCWPSVRLPLLRRLVTGGRPSRVGAVVAGPPLIDVGRQSPGSYSSRGQVSYVR